MKEYICVNGDIVSSKEAFIPVTDRGLLYGYGLFETVRVLPKGPVFLTEHLRRMKNSLNEIGLNPIDIRAIKTMVARIIDANSLKNGSLRITVSAGAQENTSEDEWYGQNVVITVKHGLPYADACYRAGFRTGFLKCRRNADSPLLKLKTLNYLDNILGRQEAFRRGWDEGLYMNHRGYLSEGTVSNLFFVESNVLYTPDVNSGLLPGITRQKVIDLALENNIQVKECPLAPSELFSSEEAFLTNSLMGIMPLVAVDEQKIGNGKAGALTQIMTRQYSKLFEGFE